MIKNLPDFEMFCGCSGIVIDVLKIILKIVGLTGEICPIQNSPDQLQVAIKRGFKLALVPASNSSKQSVPELMITVIKRLQNALVQLYQPDL